LSCHDVLIDVHTLRPYVAAIMLTDVHALLIMLLLSHVHAWRLLAPAPVTREPDSTQISRYLAPPGAA
jgi:hypothetical protein